MALGIAADRLKSCSNDIMNHSKNNVNKKMTTHEVPSHVDEHSSLLFAMQSAFREKLAVRMKADKTSRTKHKSSENEKSLMQVYETRQKLVKKYHKTGEITRLKDTSSGSSVKMKRLPPLSLRCNSDAGRYGKTTGLRKKERLHSDVTLPLRKDKMESDYSPVQYFNSSAQSINKLNLKNAAENLKFNPKEKSLEEDDLPPPNMARLRLLSNKKKQLLKMKRFSYSEQNSDASFGADQANQQRSLTDFQKWQLTQNQERQDRLERHRKKSNHNDEVFVNSNNSGFATQQHMHLKHINVQSSTKNNSTSDMNIHTLSPSKHTLSPTLDSISDEHTKTTNGGDGVTIFNETYSKQSGLSEQLHIYQNNHKMQAILSNESAQAMPGLQRPVLVRHDGRSAASSRTSTRNTFSSHSKVSNLPADNQKQNYGSKRKISDQNFPVSSFSEDIPLSQYSSQVIPEQREVILVPCSTCGRKFNNDRLEKHRAVCMKTTSKRRKVFNMSHARRKGTELETFTIVKGVSHNPTSMPRKSNWRNQHEDFIKTIKQAKVMAVYVAGGGNLADLPPPEPSLNLDYVTCQYCERRFAPKVAERHIPRCKDIKSRPPPPKSKVPKGRH